MNGGRSVKIKRAVILFIKGMFIGVANIIPGVSGGTIAVVLGIYDKLIEAISDVLSKPEKRKEHSIFLTVIFLGAGSSILLLANLMNYLLTYHNKSTPVIETGIFSFDLQLCLSESFSLSLAI